MLKKLSQAMALMLVIGVVGTLVPLVNHIPIAKANTTVSRVEWIQELVILFDMTVEENNMPDDYFTDIPTDSPYYRDVMVATEFGVVDIEAGYPFLPDQPATRDFVAHTMNFCLGFDPQETEVYPFSDISVQILRLTKMISLQLPTAQKQSAMDRLL